ncbi:MAG: ABC transporter substrate-binding protein [Rhodospirillaceae bacterium]|nr:ABC transporter substrate-binding protein [Rhodospirillaceae bacterium]
MKRRTVLALGVGLALAAALYAPPPAAARGPGRLGVRAPARTRDPIASSDNASIWVELLLYDTLIRPTKDGTSLEPGLAEKWSVSPDGKEYVFTLRQAQFSDGSPVTADDVIFSLKRAAGEKSDWARFFKPITSYEAVDDHTVRMRLDEPFTPMLNNLAMFSGSILPRALVEKDPEGFFAHPVGSGPFVLKEWRKGEAIVLAKNPHYWQPGKPAIDGAEIQVIGEDNSRVLKLQAGELDAAIAIPFNQIQMLAAGGDIKVGAADVYRIELVQLNTTKKPFDDVRVRQALNYAVDKMGIIKTVLYGNAKPAVSSIPVMRYHNTDLKPYPYDPAKAKALLAEAGLGGGFSTTMLVPAGDDTYRAVAAIIQDNLKKIGVNVELQAIEGGSQFSTTKAGNYEMSLSYATSDTVDPDQLVGFTMVNPERANAFHTAWKDERVNELYELERRTLDGPEREAQFKEIEARVHDAAPFIFLYHQQAPYAYRANVEGFEVLPTSNYRLEDVILK